ncbi:MAG TPA: oligosaccharide flippase family protein [Thermaerobacter sp.]
MGSVVRSTLWLTGGNLINRILGLGYRVLLGRFLGPTWLGLFQLAMSLYFSLLTPVVAGLPDAVARVTARSGARHPALPPVIARTAWFAAAGVTLPAAWLLLTGWTPPGPGWQEARRAVPLVWFLPALVFAALSAVVRGFFLGADRSMLIVLAQLAEQVVRVGALALVLALGGRLPLAPLVVLILLLVAGEAVGFSLTQWWYRRLVRDMTGHGGGDGGVVAGQVGEPGAGGDSGQERGNGEGEAAAARPTLWEVITLAGPATLERVLLSAARLIEVTLIPTRLVQAGLTVHQALAVYGELSGLATPLLLLPTVFSGALAAAIVPAVAGAEHDPGRLCSQVRRCVTISLHLGVLAAVLFAREGELLARLIFPGQTAGDYPGAGRLAAWIAPAALLLYTDQVSAAVLRGLGRPLEPMLVDLASAATRVAILALAIRPGLAPEDAVRMVCLAVMADVAVAGCGNLAFVLWRTGTRPDVFGWVLLPSCAGLATLWISDGLGSLLGPGLAARMAAWLAAGLAVAVIAWTAAAPSRPARPSLPG